MFKELQSSMTYWVTQKLPQIYTANHTTFPILIRKITVQICGNFWVTEQVIKDCKRTNSFQTYLAIYIKRKGETFFGFYAVSFLRAKWFFCGFSVAERSRNFIYPLRRVRNNVLLHIEPSRRFQMEGGKKMCTLSPLRIQISNLRFLYVFTILKVIGSFFNP